MLTFPDGLVGRCFGPLAGASNDRNAVMQGHLRELIRDQFHGLSLYGDSIYYDYEPEASSFLSHIRIMTLRVRSSLLSAMMLNKELKLTRPCQGYVCRLKM
jgi:hypothetical protein